MINIEELESIIRNFLIAHITMEINESRNEWLELAAQIAEEDKAIGLAQKIRDLKK